MNRLASAITVACLALAGCAAASPTPRPTGQVQPDERVEASFPFAVTCDPLDPPECAVFVDTVVANAARNDPGKTIVRVDVQSKNGSYTMTFSDGTSVMAIVN